MPINSKPMNFVSRFAAVTTLVTIALSGTAFFLVKGAFGQPIQVWKDSAGVEVCRISSGGLLVGNCAAGSFDPAETDDLYVNVAGDTMTGALVIQSTDDEGLELTNANEDPIARFYPPSQIDGAKMTMFDSSQNTVFDLLSAGSGSAQQSHFIMDRWDEVEWFFTYCGPDYHDGCYAEYQDPLGNALLFMSESESVADTFYSHTIALADTGNGPLVDIGSDPQNGSSRITGVDTEGEDFYQFYSQPDVNDFYFYTDDGNDLLHFYANTDSDETEFLLTNDIGDNFVDFYQNRQSFITYLDVEDPDGYSIFSLTSRAPGTSEATLYATANVFQRSATGTVLQLSTEPGAAAGSEAKMFVRQTKTLTTNNTQTTAQTITVPSGNTYLIESHVEARRTGGTAGSAGDSAGYVIRGTYHNEGVLAVITGAVNADYTAEDQAAWAATYDINGSDVRLRVTGATDNNVTWVVTTYIYPHSAN